MLYICCIFGSLAFYQGDCLWGQNYLDLHSVDIDPGGQPIGSEQLAVESSGLLNAVGCECSWPWKTLGSKQWVADP
jgi:hypothetical protein